MSTDPDAVDALRKNLHDAQQRIVELESALTWTQDTAVNLYCALQSTVCMDPNDPRIASITAHVVRDLLVLRERAAVAAQPRQEEGK